MLARVVVRAACTVLFAALVVQAGTVHTKDRTDVGSAPKSRDTPKAEASSKHRTVTPDSFVPVFVPKHLVHRLHTSGASALTSSQEAQDSREAGKEGDTLKRPFSYVTHARPPTSSSQSPPYQYETRTYDDHEKDTYSQPPPPSYYDRPESEQQREVYSPVRLAHPDRQTSANDQYDQRPRYHAAAVHHSQEDDNYSRHPSFSRERYPSTEQLTYPPEEDAPRYHRGPVDESSGESYDTQGSRDAYENRHRNYDYVRKIPFPSEYGSASPYQHKERPEHREAPQVIYGKPRPEVAAQHVYPLRNNEALVPSLHTTYPAREESAGKWDPRGYGQVGVNIRYIPLEPQQSPRHYGSVAEGNPYIDSGKTYAPAPSHKYSPAVTYVKPPSSPTNIRFDDTYTKSQHLLDPSRNKHDTSSQAYYSPSLGFGNPLSGRFLIPGLLGSSSGTLAMGSSGESLGDKNYYKGPFQGSEFAETLGSRFAESLRGEFGDGAQAVGSSSADKMKPYFGTDFLGSDFASFSKGFESSPVHDLSFDSSKMDGRVGYSLRMDDYATSASKQVAVTDYPSTSTSKEAKSMNTKDGNFETPTNSKSRNKRHASDGTKHKVNKVETEAPSKSPTTAEASAASGFIPISQPFSSQDFGYSPFFDGHDGLSPSFDYTSRDEGREESFGGLSFGRSSPAFHASEARGYGYDSLGSGNFEVIRGGVYANDHSSSNHVPYYLQNSGSFDRGGFGYDDTEPILGFQGFDHFGNPLHNSLTKQTHVLGSSSEKQESKDETDEHSDSLESASQLIQTNHVLEATE